MSPLVKGSFTRTPQGDRRQSKAVVASAIQVTYQAGTFGGNDTTFSLGYAY